MDQLFPIIRRVRRPLLPVDDLPTANAASTCVLANAAMPQETDGTNATEPVPMATAEAPERKESAE